MVPATINIIGCGHLGKTLAHNWRQNNTLHIGQVLNRSENSAEKAVTFIGAGQPTADYSALLAADFWLIASPDGAIAQIAQNLAQLPLNWQGKTILHCSGAHTSELLSPLHRLGAHGASVHPLHSFANPQASIQQLAGCFCSAEGDPIALTKLQPIFEALGLQWLSINADEKLLYHAAAVFSCNYLTTLLDAADRCLQATNIGHLQSPAIKILMPLVQQTLANIAARGTAPSLSGPIKRGESELIKQQLAALATHDQSLALLYQAMGNTTLPLAGLNAQDQTQIAAALDLAFENPHH